MSNTLPPVCAKRCPTCPFTDGSPYEYLRTELTISALSSASRICHNTGPANAIKQHTGKAARLCRGARDIQIRAFYANGFIEAPTDEAWFKKLAEIQGDQTPCQS